MGKVWRSSHETLKTQMAALIAIANTPGYPSLGECARILRRTWRLWVVAVGAILGLMVLIALIEGVVERVRNARQIRYEEAVASVTPDRLVARCGQPADVATKVYPIVVRTVSYQLKGNKKVVLVFSRAAEDKSDWVFLAMKDQAGARSYDTPEEKVAALPCLDSKK